MQYLFLFLLIACLSVCLLTYLLAIALFFRRKQALEKLFLAFLTCLTLRVFVDTSEFYVLPLLTDPGPLFSGILIVGRMSIAGVIVFLSLFMHRLTDILQSKKAKVVSIIAAVGLILFFTGQSVVMNARRTATTDLLYAFSLVDFFIYPLMVYPFVVFFAFSKRIKNVTIHRMIRTFTIMLLCITPFVIFEDVFGSIMMIFDFLRPDPLPLKLFPVYYLIVYLYLLYTGFKNVILERKSGAVAHGVSDEFVKHYNITAREKEIILLMIEGAGNKQIGEKLFISAATARNHLHNIFEKTGVTNRVELLRLASS
jgi:DNA-binding CsgD family transcriptional regulator